MTVKEAERSARLNCPTCSNSVYRLSLNGRLARWRARLTRRRPYACAQCGWQGTLRHAREDLIDQLPWFRAREPQRRKNKGNE